MGRTISFTTMYANLPPLQFVKVQTKRTFNRGYMLNGAHLDDWKKLDLFLEVCRHEAKCRSCRRVIQGGELIGDGLLYSDGVHCLECIEGIPDGLEVWEISWRMKRKSARAPDGVKREVLVNLPEINQKYIDELSRALGCEIHVDHVAPALAPQVQAAVHEPALPGPIFGAEQDPRLRGIERCASLIIRVARKV